MKIAVIEDETRRVASLFDKSRFAVYGRRGGRWDTLYSFENAFCGAEGLPHIRTALAEAVKNLGGAPILVSTEVPGIAASFFETAGVGIFIVEQAAMEARCITVSDLLGLIEKEVPDIVREAQKNAPKPGCGSGCGNCGSGCGAPRAAGSGNVDFSAYASMGGSSPPVFDLAKALAENPGEISKTVLIPYLKSLQADTVDILCDHPPKWFDTELPGMGYACGPAAARGKSVMIRLTRT